MKHVWVVESSGGRKWSADDSYLHPTKKSGQARADMLKRHYPGLQWRVSKYERVK